MDNLYERLVDLLDKPQADEDLKRLVEDLNDVQRSVLDTEHLLYYEFPTYCLEISVDKEPTRIMSVHLHAPQCPDATDQNAWHRGQLPGGWQFGDDRATVHKKVGARPARSERRAAGTKKRTKDYWDFYYLGPLSWTLIFDGDTKRLCLLSFRRRFEDEPPEPEVPVPYEVLCERGTKAVNDAVHAALAECRRLKHQYLGTDQLFLGLLAEGSGVAAIALSSSGVTLGRTRKVMESIIGRGWGPPPQLIRTTPAAKSAITRSVQIAEALGHGQVDTQHLLLALLEGSHGVLFEILEKLGISPESIRQQVLSLIGE